MTWQHDSADMRVDTAQVFESLDRSDLSGRHTQQCDRLAGKNGRKSQIVDQQLDDASETAVVFRRSQNDFRRCRELLPQRFDVTGYGLTGKWQLHFIQIDNIHCRIVTADNLVGNDRKSFGREIVRPHAPGNYDNSNRFLSHGTSFRMA